jgi:hypothetical protein
MLVGRAFAQAMNSGQRPGRHLGGGDDGDVGQFPGERHRLEVALRVERHAPVEVLVDGELAEGRGADRVPIGRRLRHGVDADVAAGARPVLHHEGLGELVAHALGQQTHQDVDRAAGRVRHDHPDRPVGVALGALGGCDGRRAGGG